MSDLIRIAFRKLGGEPDAAPLSPPWFLPGAQDVWNRIVETERALRGVVRDVYVTKLGPKALGAIEAAVPESARTALTRALRARPAEADPMSIVDYLYLADLPALLFAPSVWDEARKRLGDSPEAKPR